MCATALQVRIKSKGGHSSMPPTDGTSVGSIAGRILTKLDANPPPCVLQPPTTEFVKGLAQAAPGGCRQLLQLPLVAADKWTCMPSWLFCVVAATLEKQSYGVVATQKHKVRPAGIDSCTEPAQKHCLLRLAHMLLPNGLPLCSMAGTAAVHG